MTTVEFAQAVSAACAESEIVAAITVAGAGVTWLQVRVFLTDGSFVDAFYNEATGKTAYALIREETRVFGADNTRGWHWHLWHDPAGHVPATEPVSFRQFLIEIEGRLSSEGG